MWKAMALLAVLFMGATVRGGTLSIQEYRFSGTLFYVDIVISGLAAPTQMAGMSLGVSLTGGGGAITPCRSDAAPHPNRYTGSAGQALLTPDGDTYAWAAVTDASTSMAVPPLVNFAVLTADLSTVTVSNGNVVARIHWQWNGVGPMQEVNLHVQGANPGETPYYVSDQLDFLELTAGPDVVIPIPEPATMALLGLGLAGLALRRRK